MIKEPPSAMPFLLHVVEAITIIWIQFIVWTTNGRVTLILNTIVGPWEV
jgi:hypothetical protein